MSASLRILVLLALAMPALIPGRIDAHELQPSSLEMRQIAEERFELVWRAPIYFGKPHPARLQLPQSWQVLQPPSITQLDNSALHRYLLAIPGQELEGAEIYFEGLETTITDVFVRFVWLDGHQTTALARPGQPRVEVAVQRSAWQVSVDYTLLGIEHILSGFDHLSFVLALLLLVRGVKQLLITVTSFTLAHSITLAAATLGLLWVPGPPVEAVIALSILFLAGELIRIERGEDSLTARNPWLVAFTFGLLHGFGFAGALGDIGLPSNEVPLALLTFNIGVEIGQLLFIALIVAVIALLKGLWRDWPRWMYRAPAYGIGGIAAFWLIERVAGF